MRIREITLRELAMKLIAPFEISNGVSYRSPAFCWWKPMSMASLGGLNAWPAKILSTAPRPSRPPGTFYAITFGR